jgi:hypothetical protein
MTTTQVPAYDATSLLAKLHERFVYRISRSHLAYQPIAWVRESRTPGGADLWIGRGSWNSDARSERLELFKSTLELLKPLNHGPR